MAVVGFALFIAPLIADIVLGDRQVLVSGLDKYDLWMLVAGVGIAVGIVAFALASARTTSTAAIGFHAVAIVLLMALGGLFTAGYVFFLAEPTYRTVQGEAGQELVLREWNTFMDDDVTEVFVRNGLVLDPVG